MILSKIYFTIIVIISILAFALIAETGIMPKAFVNVLAQEGAINPENLVNNTQIDKDRGTTRSSTDFSAINDTMSDQNTLNASNGLLMQQ
jgi:hypothetical protein